MFKKLIIISIISLSIIVFSNFAWSSVEGTWDVQGKMTVKVSIKGHKSQTVRINYNITVYNMNGTVLFTKSVEGIGDIGGDIGFDFSENPSKAASRAITDGVNKAMDAILTSEEIMALIKK